MAARFWVGGTGNWDASTTTHWASSSGGSGGASVPTSADTVTFDANSGASATVTITAPANASAVTINKSDLTLTHSSGSTVTGAMTLTTGTLNTNGQTCSWGSFVQNSGSSATLTLGGSAITITAGGTAWNVSGAGPTITANTATITCSGATTVALGGLNWNGATFSLTAAGPGNVTASGATVGGLIRTNTAAVTDALQINGNLTVTGTLQLNSNSAVNRLLVSGNPVGTAITLSAATVTVSGYVDFRDINAAGAATWTTAGTGATALGNCAGCSGITFTVGAGTSNGLGGVYRYWVGDTGSASNTAHWSTSSGGSTGASLPLPQDTIIVDANSLSATGKTLTFDFARFPTCDFSAATKTFTLTFTQTVNNFFGDFILSANVNLTNQSTWQFVGRGSQILTTAGKAFGGTAGIVAIISVGGTYAIQDAYAFGCRLECAYGTLDLNGQSGSAYTLEAAAGNVSQVKLGTGTLTINGQHTGQALAFSAPATLVASSSTIILNDTTATNKTFSTNGLAFNNVVITTGGSGTWTFSGNNSFAKLTCSGAQTVIGTSGSTQTVTALITNGATYQSTSAGTPWTLVLPSNQSMSAVDNCSWKDVTATNTLYAGSASTIVSGCTGVQLSDQPGILGMLV